jgi:arylformamidase
LVGIDSPSIDLGLDSRFLAHHELLDNGILILENLCNLEKILGVHFKLVVLPLKLKGATGSPVRAIAL